MAQAAPTREIRPATGVLAGAGVGLVGGLLGLGGAEFRLPLLVGVFGYALRPAIALNVVVSLVTVLAGLGTRLLRGGTLWPSATDLPIGLALALSGMIGAAIASRWLSGLSDRHLHHAVRGLLLGIGLLLVGEALWPHGALHAHLAGPTRYLVGALAGVAIGAVASLLGVAGGELLIPTLVYGFGLDVKAAGTLSLGISMPTLLVSLSRQRIALPWTPPDRRLVGLLWTGSIGGAVVGGFLAGFVPASAVKVVLGLVLIGSALRVFRPSGVGPHAP